MNNSIGFPNLGIEFEHVGKSIDVFGFSIAYYGIIIAVAFVIGIIVVMCVAKSTAQDPDQYFDFALIAFVFAIIGARLYYVIFTWDSYKNNMWVIFNFRQGGLAIYGGVIAAVITAYVYARVKKLPFWKLADTSSIGLVLGQIIGRWGNFFNREAFGEYTNGLFAMRLPLDAVRQSEVTAQMIEHVQTINGVEYIQVHPTFLYEGLWNLAVLLLLIWYTKRKKSDGEVFLLYLLGYGLGRAWIEGLRTDQLLIPGMDFPISQALAVVLVIISSVMIVAKRRSCRMEKGTGESYESNGRVKKKD